MCSLKLHFHSYFPRLWLNYRPPGNNYMSNTAAKSCQRYNFRLAHRWVAHHSLTIQAQPYSWAPAAADTKFANLIEFGSFSLRIGMNLFDEV